MLLIAFHFGTLLFLDIVFPLHVLINALLFVMSPYPPAKANWRAMLAAGPLLGWIFRRAFGWAAAPIPLGTRAAPPSRSHRSRRWATL